MKSEIIKKGLEKAPHRSLLNALGLTKWEKDRPFIGIVNSQNDLVPGHIHLNQIAGAVKGGGGKKGGPFFFSPGVFFLGLSKKEELLPRQKQQTPI